MKRMSWYECKARNVAGEASKRLRLQVRVPPSMSLREEAYTVIIGHNVTLHCDATGIPPPTYSWSFNNRPVQGSMLPFAQLPNGHLVLFDVTTIATGSYECTAGNNAGNATKYIALAVFVPPLIQVRNDSELVAIMGRTILLDCSAQGIPIPRVSWRRNGKELVVSLQSRQPGSPPTLHPVSGNDQSMSYDEASSASSAPSVSRFNQHMEVAPNGTLVIRAVSLSDAGLYTCVVDNAAGADTKDIQLVVHDPPKILQSAPVNATAIEHRRITLPCPVTGSPKPTIRWSKRELEIFDSDPRIKIMPDGSLEFLQPVAEDAGTYKCRATNVAGEAIHSIDLKVYVPPRFLKVSMTEQAIEEMTAIKNETVTFDCPVYAVPRAKLSWYRGQTLIQPQAGGLQQQDYSRYNISWDAQRLTIVQVLPEDQGEYACSATNIAGQAQRAFKLNIFVPPTILEDRASPANLSVIIENDIAIFCPAEGIPKPQILWYKDNSLLFPGDVSFNLSPDSQQLQIRRAHLQSAGTYRCDITNIAGAVHKEFLLEVYVPPAIKNADEVSMSEIIINNTMDFHCDVEGFPAPRISWFKSEQPIALDSSPSQSSQRIRLEADGRRLKLIKVTRADSGTYACHAANAAGRSVKLFKLDVLVPPSIDFSLVPNNATVIVNNSVILRCPSSGHPIPEIVWYKDDDVIDARTDAMLKFSEGGQRLEIVNTRITDTARYQCVVANKAGQDRIAIDLDVLVPASIELAQIDVRPRVVVNKSLTITCPATGIPPPRIWWLKDGVALPSVYAKLQRHRILRSVSVGDRGRQLEIGIAKVEDAGVYTCRAENSAGTSEVSYHVQVLVPPRIERWANKTIVQVVVNRSATLECFALGIPKPVLAWFRNGVPFDPAKIVTNVPTNSGDRFMMNNKPRLEISRADQDPPGGLDTQALLLPTLNQGGFSSSSSSSVNANERLSGISRWSLKADSQVLELASASVGDAARYSCVASNDAGSADRFFDVDVFVPPTIALRNVDREPKVIKGRTAVLNCPATGIPMPVITWFKDDVQVKPDGRHQMLSGGRQLEMSSVVESDAGQYTCVAQNEAGADKLLISLRTLVPPNMQVDNLVDRPRIVVNRTVILECPADGLPPPQITWQRNGHLLVVDDHMVVDEWTTT